MENLIRNMGNRGLLRAPIAAATAHSRQNNGIGCEGRSLLRAPVAGLRVKMQNFWNFGSFNSNPTPSLTLGPLTIYYPINLHHISLYRFNHQLYLIITQNHYLHILFLIQNLPSLSLLSPTSQLSPQNHLKLQTPFIKPSSNPFLNIIPGTNFSKTQLFKW